MNCTICKEPLDPALHRSTTHPTCFPFDELDEGDPFATMLKTKLIDVILWAERQNARGHQVQVGPSELGTPCDRRLGYRAAEVPPCNTDMDPWPSIAGTAIHSWLEQSFAAYNDSHVSPADWMTESTLSLAPDILAHSDLYNVEHQAVIDWKTAGPDVMKKYRRDGAPVGHQIQTHLYGYGFTQTGLPVKKVCLAVLPRAGWLKDMYVWCADYDESIAVGAINRLYQIATQVVELDTLTHSHRWEQIEATPSNDCAWCPWYNPGRDTERGADAQGCPGR